jgi:hypothetical protein
MQVIYIDLSDRFVTANPASFRVGDVVEAQISFVLVPIRDNKFTLKLVLRALSLLDSNQTKVFHNNI